MAVDLANISDAALDKYAATYDEHAYSLFSTGALYGAEGSHRKIDMDMAYEKAIVRCAQLIKGKAVDPPCTLNRSIWCSQGERLCRTCPCGPWPSVVLPGGTTETNLRTPWDAARAHCIIRQMNGIHRFGLMISCARVLRIIELNVSFG